MAKIVEKNYCDLFLIIISITNEAIMNSANTNILLEMRVVVVNSKTLLKLLLVLLATNKTVAIANTVKVAGVAYFSIFLGNCSISQIAEFTSLRILNLLDLFFSLLSMEYPPDLN